MITKHIINDRILVILFITVILPVIIIAGGGPGGFKPNEIICKMKPGGDIETINEIYGTVIKSYQEETDCYLLMITQGQDPEELADIIGSRPDVHFCGANYFLAAPEPYQRSQAFLDNYNSDDFISQLAVQTLDLNSTWLLSTGENVKVAVIDGGINFDHPQFDMDTAGVVSGWDYVDDDSIAYDEPGGINSGHGTFITGIIKLVAPQSIAVGYRVLDTAGIGDGYNIASAVLKALDDSCRIMNLSFGMQGIHAALDEALRYASNQNVTLITAAGNDSTDFNLVFPFPASREYCLAVAALDSFNIKADFSNYGYKIDVCAPGTSIYSLFIDTLYARWDGTSFSTAFVSGLGASIYSVYQGITHFGIKNIIRSSAVNIDSLNPDYAGLLGDGLIDPVATLNMVLDYTMGDINGDYLVNLLDITNLIAYLYSDGEPPVPDRAADVDCNATINILDITFLINYLYKDGPPPCNN